MKFEYRPDNTKQKFGNISAGRFFEWNGELYLKLEVHRGVNALAVAQNRPTHFDSSTTVSIMQHKLEIWSDK